MKPNFAKSVESSKGPGGRIGDQEVQRLAREAGIIPRRLCDIAWDIFQEWPAQRMYFGALPYAQAMQTLQSIDDMYGYDSARDIVTRFLCNAGTWRGEAARRIKAELKAMLNRGAQR